MVLVVCILTLFYQVTLALTDKKGVWTCECSMNMIHSQTRWPLC